MQDLPPASVPVRKTEKARTLSAAVLERLREDIIACRLLPGARLRLDTLRESYKVGFSPLREALMKLANDHLVELEDQRGFRVSPVSEKDLEDVTATRVLLDKTLIKEALRLGDDQWEGGVVAAYHRLSLVSAGSRDGSVEDIWFARHADFHYSLISAAQSELLRRFWWIAYERAERYRRLAVTFGTKRRDDLAEHEALMQAALSRDTALACQLSELHIQKTRDIVRYDIGNRLDIFKTSSTAA